MTLTDDRARLSAQDAGTQGMIHAGQGGRAARDGVHVRKRGAGGGLLDARTAAAAWLGCTHARRAGARRFAN